MKIKLTVKTKGNKGNVVLKRKIKDGEPDLFCLGGTRELRRVSAAVRIADAVLRVILSLTVAVLCLLLCACSEVLGYTEPEDRYIVSAFGFDVRDGLVSVTARIANAEGAKVKVCEGRGESVEYAVSHIEEADAKQLETSHCAVIVIGEGVDKELLGEIFDYCRRNDDITVSAHVIAAHDARELLELEEAEGFDIVGALRKNDGSGFTAGSRFYEIEGERTLMGEDSVFHLPCFSVADGAYILDGLRLYRGDGWLVRLDRTESVYYMMARGEFTDGVADIELWGEDSSIPVRNSKTEYKTELLKDGKRVIYIVCTLGVNKELLPRGSERDIESACSKRSQGICRELTSRYGDVLGLSRKLGLSPLEVSGSELFVECRVK